MNRIMALVERDLRRFRRSPVLMVVSMIFPIVQLVVLGYAFGGKLKHLTVAVVDQDQGLPAVQLREMLGSIENNAQTFEVLEYSDLQQALTDLRNGRVNGVLNIPPEFSRHQLSGGVPLFVPPAASPLAPQVALVEDNTDGFVSSTLEGTFAGMINAYNQRASGGRIAPQATLSVVEIYPYVPYIQYLLPGSIVLSIFVMVMIGGGIIYIDDKARGLHEGYLVTPITKFELIMGFNLAGTIKAILSGSVLMTVGSVIAGIPNAFDPGRLAQLFVVIAVTGLALVSMMFLLMVRVSDPLVPRAVFGVLNTLLFFPSGAVYPLQAFPAWMRAISTVDPFTYSVHAFKQILLKNTPMAAVSGDLIYLSVFAIIMMAAATTLFKRTL
jgi:ABC-2 type transport system permease protein